MRVINSESIPVFLWLEDIEDGALRQAFNLANLPFAFHHIGIMPDSHQGFGMPIGGVLATDGVVVPNAVGSDIGCGMCAVKTPWTEIPAEMLKKILGMIRAVIPTGMNRHKTPLSRTLLPDLPKDPRDLAICYPVVSQNIANCLISLESLGGGNHFGEVQKDTDGFYWIMIHSGSRNVGKQIADHYNASAIDLNKQWYTKVPKAWDLAFLPCSHEIGEAYIREMEFAVEYAFCNRKLMMEKCIECFKSVLGCGNVDLDGMINIAHNYARMENHFGRNVMVHRKGATSARVDEIGIIPGSQGTKSYIVRGLGNPMSFTSCSHGAGRKMGRKEASRRLDLAEEIRLLDEQGIIHGIRTIKDLDEAAGAYKDIDVVMENQKDLVEIMVELSPVAVIKG